ncbi:MAG TPA: LuxR C-terminal-related transcriptional regulator [Chroococcales cyanobacterium]
MMLTQSPSIHICSTTLQRPNPLSNSLESVLLQRVIESFFDGILVLTEQGDWVQANPQARQICDRIIQTGQQPNAVPEQIWRACRMLIESSNLPLERAGILETELASNRSTPLRIRVRSLKLSATARPYLLVILEDRYQSTRNLAIAEADKYGLTPREADVWLLRRTNHSLKEIAAELHISLNTVKKHMKNIQAKRESVF